MVDALVQWDLGIIKVDLPGFEPNVNERYNNKGKTAKDYCPLRFCPFSYCIYRILRKVIDAKLAAIELINILRPITAIATYITFGALALYKYPRCKESLLKES